MKSKAEPVGRVLGSPSRVALDPAHQFRLKFPPLPAFSCLRSLCLGKQPEVNLLVASTAEREISFGSDATHLSFRSPYPPLPRYLGRCPSAGFQIPLPLLPLPLSFPFPPSLLLLLLHSLTPIHAKEEYRSKSLVNPTLLSSIVALSSGVAVFTLLVPFLHHILLQPHHHPLIFTKALIISSQ